MKAIFADRYGAPEEVLRVREVDMPVPDDDPPGAIAEPAQAASRTVAPANAARQPFRKRSVIMAVPLNRAMQRLVRGIFAGHALGCEGAARIGAPALASCA